MNEGKFLCHWCGTSKPVGERVIEKDESGHATWIGCSKCQKRRG